MDEEVSNQRPAEAVLSDEESGDEETATIESDTKTAISDKLISLNLLDRKNIQKIKADFKKRKDGLLKSEFINIMLHHLPEQTDTVALVASLNELFAEIDVNDDHHLEWDEFTDYIIAAGLVKRDQGFVDVIKRYAQAEWKDPVKHDNDVEHIHFIPEVKQLLVMERDSRKFKVYNSKTLRFEREVHGHSGSVLAAQYLTKDQAVCTASNDLTVLLWNPANYEILTKLSSPVIPFCMVEYGTCLYVGGPEGAIHYWNLAGPLNDGKPKVCHPFQRERIEGTHDSTVSAMLAIPSINTLATGDMAGKLILWEMPSRNVKRRMVKLKKGIHSLAWNEEAGCLFSAGLERTAYVWNPYVSKHIYKISEHNHSLVSIKCIPKTHQMVTADISGMFKVWDIRTFTVIQSFNAPVEELNAFEVTFPEKKILAGGKVLFQYMYEEPKDQNQVDEGIPLCSFYNPQYNTIITAHPTCIKHWDISTGKLSKVFREVTESDITAVALDNKMRKLYVGDSKGKVITVKVKNGAVIKHFAEHADEVSALAYWAKCKFLISASRDFRVRIHDDSKSTDIGLVRFDKIEHEDVVCGMDLNEEHSLIASCSDDTTVLITNLLTLRQEAEYVGHEAEIKAVKFLEPEPLLVATDLAGKIYFWGIPQTQFKNTLLLTIVNTVVTETRAIDETPIKALAWCPKRRMLLTGDEKGRLKQRDLGPFTRKLRSVGHGLREQVEAGFYLTETTERPTAVLSEADAAVVLEFAAHTESITDITIVAELDVFITCGFDLRAHVWSFEGEQMGSLIVGGDPHWSLKFDSEAKVQATRREAHNLLKESMSVSYEEMIREMEKDIELSESEPDSDDSEDFFLSDKLDTLKAKPIVKPRPVVRTESDSFTREINERKLALQRLMGSNRPPLRNRSGSTQRQDSSRNRTFTGAARSMISNR